VEGVVDEVLVGAIVFDASVGDDAAVGGNMQHRY
jgi:hypothetical protein